MRALVLIDEGNLYRTGLDLGVEKIKVDFIKFKAFIDEKFKGSIIRLYTGQPPVVTRFQKGFWAFCGHIGIEVVKVRVLEKNYNIIKDFVDERIIYDIKSMYSDYEAIFLVSGDGDYIGILKYVKKRGKEIIVGGFPRHCHRLLMEIADEFIDLERFKK